MSSTQVQDKPNSSIDFSHSREECILMFSGGRDSTLAAIRLLEEGIQPVLVTVMSGHLFGYDAVETRLKELKSILPLQSIHLQVTQPQDLRVNQDFYFRTCLPCQHAYVIVAAALAKRRGVRKIALGYASYQGDWPEQTPIATTALSEVLAEFDLELLLPVYSMDSKDRAKDELAGYALSAESLEQKCSRQVRNVTLNPVHLAEQVGAWQAAIRASLRQLDEIQIEVRATRYLGSY